jgi:hypothetical protein
MTSDEGVDINVLLDVVRMDGGEKHVVLYINMQGNTCLYPMTSAGELEELRYRLERAAVEAWGGVAVATAQALRKQNEATR